MSTQLTRQEQLFGEVEEHYGKVSIPNKDLWPFVRVVNSLVDECRLETDGETFSVLATDPANVAMVDVEFEPDTSIQWTDDIGLRVDYLNGRLQNKPRTENNSVDVKLDIAKPYGSINVSEDVNGRTFHLAERLGLIDIESIRQSPDVPELDLPASVEIPVSRIYHFIRNKPEGNHVVFESLSDEVRIAEASSMTDYSAALTFEEETEEAEAMYSPDYLEDIFKAIGAIGCETVEFTWGTDFPCKIHFETDNIRGMFLQAPRVQQ